MEAELVTIKISKKGRDLLRLVSALAGEKHYEVLERLLEKEKAAIQANEKNKSS